MILLQAVRVAKQQTVSTKTEPRFLEHVIDKIFVDRGIVIRNFLKTSSIRRGHNDNRFVNDFCPGRRHAAKVWPGFGRHAVPFHHRPRPKG